MNPTTLSFASSNPFSTCVRRGLGLLDNAGTWLGPLGLRLILAKEFWDSGLEKWNGVNWFNDIREQFPFPFHVLPADVSWSLATWSEAGGAIALVLGLGTRFFSLSLFVVTIVAWVSVHAGNGYNVCDNGWKLPLMYLVMLLPLMLSGPGRLSLDHAIRAWVWREHLGYGRSIA